MYKKFISSLALLISAKVWALSCSAPMTISDLQLDGSYVHVHANEKGDAVVSWISNQAHKEAVTIAYKTQNSTWTSPELISKWEESIYRNRCFINSDGDLFATWEAERDDNDLIQCTERQQGRSWTLPLDWVFPNGKFYYSHVKFDPCSQLVFTGGTYIKSTTKPAYPGRLTYEKEIPGIAIMTKAPGHSVSNWDAFSVDEDAYSVSDLSLAMNKNGVAYVFWVTNKSHSRTLMGRKIKNNQFVSEPEIVCQVPEYIYELRVSLNDKEEIAIAYQDAEDNGYLMTKFGNSWSDPFLFTTAEEDPTNLHISIDNAGNVMTVCDIKMGEHYSVKAIYKPFEQTWMNPVLFSQSNADNWYPKVKPDGKGNFVLIWQQQIRSRNAIFGATFSTQDQKWSDSQLLSPQGEPCFGYSFTFWAPGKGYIAWTAKPNGFDESVQVAELSN